MPLPSDLRQAARGLRGAPLLTLTALVSIGLGVGANTTVFSWLNALVLHPFPAVRDPDRVVGLEVANPTGDGWPVSFPTYRQWREEARSFSALAAWTITRVSVREPGEQGSAPLLAMTATGTYFDVLGGTPLVGRAFQTEDERLASPVVILGYAYWMRRYAGDRSVLGRTLYLNGEPMSVIGIARPRFVGTYVGVVPDLFIPITLQPRLTGTNVFEDRNARAFQVVARLEKGISVRQASAELDALARRLSSAAGDRPVTGATVMDIRTQYLGGIVLPLFSTMLVVTGLLLIIACANVASLLLVRATARRSELALRLAIGASRGRIARLIGIESALLALGGGTVGVAVAFFARGILAQLIPTGTFPITLPIPLDWRVLVSALATASLVTLGCGLLPAMRSTRISPAAALKAGERSIGTGRSRVRSGIVTAQLAFSLVCLVAAGAFVNGLRAASAADLGFSDPDQLLLVNTNVSAARFTDTLGQAATRMIMERTRTIPGVRATTVSTMVPLGFGGRQIVGVRVEGYAPAPDEDVSAIRAYVGPVYAAVMGIRLVEGRDFSDGDRSGSLPVAMVNETLAHHFWPRGSALGHQVDAGNGWATVVGVLHDGKYGSVAERPQGVAYLPIAQWYQPSFTVLVRTTSDPRTLIEPLRRVLQSVHIDIPALQPRTLADHMAASTFVQRTGAEVLAAFGALALLLSVVGLYGALAAAVALRAHELSIRVALGAKATSVVWSVARQSFEIAGVGTAIGVLLALIAARVLRQQLASVGTIDGTIVAAGATLLWLAAIGAAIAPALRAVRLNPADVLRGQ